MKLKYFEQTATYENCQVHCNYHKTTIPLPPTPQPQSMKILNLTNVPLS